MTEDEMVGWHLRLDGHESEKALGVGEGQGSLACCSAWGRKELDSPDRLNRTGDLYNFLSDKRASDVFYYLHKSLLIVLEFKLRK